MICCGSRAGRVAEDIGCFRSIRAAKALMRLGMGRVPAAQLAHHYTNDYADWRLARCFAIFARCAL